jgi:hypothetical protein
MFEGEMMLTKRCFNFAEAMAYLGIKRRAFHTHILPLLRGKGVRIGTSLMFEALDLDAAWERYKMIKGAARIDEPLESAAGLQALSRLRATGPQVSGPAASPFEAAASKVMKARRSG